MNQFWQLYHLCCDAMKLSDVASAVQGTSFVLNFTHPICVKNTSVTFGVGKAGTLRSGGVKTATRRSPTKAPIKSHVNDIILLIHDLT